MSLNDKPYRRCLARLGNSQAWHIVFSWKTGTCRFSWRLSRSIFCLFSLFSRDNSRVSWGESRGCQTLTSWQTTRFSWRIDPLENNQFRYECIWKARTHIHKTQDNVFFNHLLNHSAQLSVRCQYVAKTDIKAHVWCTNWLSFIRLFKTAPL